MPQFNEDVDFGQNYLRRFRLSAQGASAGEIYWEHENQVYRGGSNLRMSYPSPPAGREVRFLGGANPTAGVEQVEWRSFPPTPAQRTLTADQAYSASTWTTVGLNSSAAIGQSTDVGWPANGTARVLVPGVYQVEFCFTLSVTANASARIIVLTNTAHAAGTFNGTPATGGTSGCLSALINVTAANTDIVGQVWCATAGNFRADNPGFPYMTRMTLQRIITT